MEKAPVDTSNYIMSGPGGGTRTEVSVNISHSY